MRAVKEVQQQIAARSSGLAAAPGAVIGFPARARQFLQDVRGELRNVTWPNWEDIKSTTVTVIITTFFFGFYLGMALDVPLSRLVSWLIRLGQRLVQ